MERTGRVEAARILDELTTQYGGELASTWVGTIWEKRAEVPGCLVKSRDQTNANSQLALAA
jgi:hypothetical protein